MLFGGVLFPMNIRFLCVFIFLMCALAAGIADAHTLHVGNKTFALSQTKYTTPSLAFGFGNEVWYAPMTTTDLLITTLRINTNNQNYSLCEPPEFQNVPENCNCVFTDTENYTYDNDGRLIGADERLWLKNNSRETGGYIDTNFIANNNTRIKTKIYLNTRAWFFCARQAANRSSFCLLWATDDIIKTDYGNSRASSVKATGGIYIIDKNKNVTTYTHPNGQTYTITQNTQNFTTPMSMPILASYNAPNTLSINSSNHRHYYFKIWDNEVLVRDMVPVPACMRIGDFVVPENGMWDIVEQKFYGNANATGTIIYGKDK